MDDFAIKQAQRGARYCDIGPSALFRLQSVRSTKLDLFCYSPELNTCIIHRKIYIHVRCALFWFGYIIVLYGFIPSIYHYPSAILNWRRYNGDGDCPSTSEVTTLY